MAADDPRAFITRDVIDALGRSDFDMWHYSREQCQFLLEAMFIELGAVTEFNIERDVLESFLSTVRHNYHETPFHNFHHAFCVAQMVYTIFTTLKDRPDYLNSFEKFAVLIAAVIHDLDHRGLTNAYHINSRSDLAINYNDQSVLENHHCATGFRILARPRCNILQHLSVDQFKKARKLIVSCVLSTDMAKNILRPLWEGAALLWPELQSCLLSINENLAHWNMFMTHKRSQIMLHVVEKSMKPGIIFNGGDAIVRMGEVSSKMYFLRSGTVEVRAEDMTTVWDTMSQGAFFGEVGAFKGIPRTANIVAKTQCEVLVVDKDDVLSLLTPYPAHVRFIEDICAERLELHQRREQLKRSDLLQFAG
eukprot:c10526_g1_i2.p1 GENE.c10526_g1_i2~~c10526_g1_i2.p1  ORF type:complete len:377 (-),score=80.82 c10526_g1_i2:99-1190(-)